MTYPLQSGLYATLANKFIPSDTALSYTREISISLKF